MSGPPQPLPPLPVEPLVDELGGPVTVERVVDEPVVVLDVPRPSVFSNVMVCAPHPRSVAPQKAQVRRFFDMSRLGVFPLAGPASSPPVFALSSDGLAVLSRWARRVLW